MIKQVQYFDDKTGEVFKTNKTKYPNSFTDEGMLYKARSSKAIFDKKMDLPDCLTFADKGRFFELARRTYRQTNFLGYRSNGKVKPYTDEQIGEILALNERQAKRYINKLIKLGVMARCRVQFNTLVEIQYYINPLYYLESKRLNDNLYLLFRSELDKHLPEWAKVEFKKRNNL